MEKELLIFYLRMRRQLLVLVLFLIAGYVYGQEITVSGTVDDGRLPLAGVNVSVVDSDKGTMTDFDGNYVLIGVPSDATLHFSFVGFKSKDIPIDGQGEIHVTLENDPQSLDEVVVVGYGTQRRSDLTGAISSIDADAIAESGVVAVDQILQGRVAGVQVQQNSGMPGASNSVRVRGISSLSASTEPIYVIDGVIIEGGSSGDDNTNTNALASINTEDIVSIDVLKDASATAIYGSRASNGVIVITTKRGRSGEMKVAYHGYVGMQQLPKRMSLLNLREYAAHRNVLADYSIATRSSNFINPDLLGEGTDWQRELFNNAYLHNHNLTISGGGDKSTYSLVGGYLDQDGIAAGSGFNRVSLSGNFDSQVKSFLKAGVNFSFNNLHQELTVSDQNLVNTALRTTPDVPVRNPDGSFAASDAEFMPTNPMAMALLIDNKMESYGIRGNTYLSADITPDLNFRTELALDYNTTNTNRFQPTYFLSETQFRDDNEGTFSKQYNKFYTWRNILTYTKDIGVHRLTGMLGQEMQKSSWEFLGGSRTGYTTNGATDLNLGDATTAANSGYTGASTIASEFGRILYAFDDRYLLTTTLRRDRSSKFAPKNRTGWFPSAALAWRASKEKFLEDSDAIRELKLRLGWGLVGNQNIPDNYAYLASYGTAITNWGTGLIAQNTPNEDLKWESTESINLGVDLNLWDGRIDFSADFYYKKTKNLLLQASLPAYAGTSGTGSSSSPWVNLGALENKGFEFSLSTVNIQGTDFNWQTNMTFSLNRNKVLSINTQTGTDERYMADGSDRQLINKTVVGQPIGQFYGYKVIGRFEKATDFYYKDTEGEIRRTPVMFNLPIDDESGLWVGDYIYKDVNDDGVIDESDRTFIGNPQPDFTFGIGNSFTYKNWGLNIFLTGSVGNDAINYTRRTLENPRVNTSNLSKKAMRYARVELIDPDGPNDFRNVHITGGDWDMSRLALGGQSSDYNYVLSDRFIEDASYLRIQNISLSYNFPSKWLSKIKIQSLRLYANLQNVYTFTKYSGYDPEIGISYSGGSQLYGVDNGRYPTPRMYTIGMNLSL